MEEAEALASNVAIMRTNVLAAGSLRSLNNTYGGAFRLRGARCANVDPEVAKEKVLAVFANIGMQVMRYMDMKGVVQFFVQYEKSHLAAILIAMEGLKGGSCTTDQDQDGQATGSSGAETKSAMKVFEDYTLTEPTLEEVFMNVVKEGEAGDLNTA